MTWPFVWSALLGVVAFGGAFAVGWTAATMALRADDERRRRARFVEAMERPSWETR